MTCPDQQVEVSFKANIRFKPKPPTYALSNNSSNIQFIQRNGKVLE